MRNKWYGQVAHVALEVRQSFVHMLHDSISLILGNVQLDEQFFELLRLKFHNLPERQTIHADTTENTRIC